MCGIGIVACYVLTQIREVGDCLRRPFYFHTVFGAGSSFFAPQEAIHFLTRSWEMSFPASIDAIACLILETCQSFMSRYSFIACAVRKARLRPVFLASSSSRFLAERSTRTEKVALFGTLFICVHYITLAASRKLLIKLINDSLQATGL